MLYLSTTVEGLKYSQQEFPTIIISDDDSVQTVAQSTAWVSANHAPLSNPVRINHTEYVFTANEAPRGVNIVVCDRALLPASI